MKYTPEEIAELLKERPNQPHYIAALVRRAVREEREACAKVCDGEVVNIQRDGEPYAALVAGICAASIRARGQEPPR